MKSPFERVAELPALAACGHRARPEGAGTRDSGPSGVGKVCLHFEIRGLLGAARALAMGALARGRASDPPQKRPGLVLAIVEDPETALDLLADLRAFLAVEESQFQIVQPTDRAAPRETENLKLGIGNSRAVLKPDAWADENLPASASLPEELKTGLPLEAALFPAWDVLPTESDRPEGVALAGRQRVLARLRQIRKPQPGAAGASPAVNSPTGEGARGSPGEGARGSTGEGTRGSPGEGARGSPGEGARGSPGEGARGSPGEGARGSTGGTPVAPPEGGDPLPQALVIIAPVAALMQPCEPVEDTGAELVLRRGGTWDPIALGRRLDQLGYDRTGQVEVRGEFALRGGILDLFPYTAEQPYRLDFDGEVIESIRPFDPLSQRSEEPVAEVILPDSSPDRLRKLFSPGTGGGPWSLLDHLPPAALVVWEEPDRLAERAELYAASLVSGRSLHLPLPGLRAQAQARFDTVDLREAGPGAADDDFADEEDGDDAAESAQATAAPELGAAGVTPAADGPTGGTPVAPRHAALYAGCTSLQRLQGEITAHAGEWKRLAASRMALYVFCETPGDQRRLETLLREAGVLPAPSVKLIPGRISGGFDLRAAGLAAIADHEILGRHKHPLLQTRRARLAAEGRPLSSLFELHPGDFVVHAAHGLGRYLGLARLEKTGRTEDYLTLLFADQVKLYVPAAQIGLVSRYIGGQTEPELSRIGSKTWARKKERVRQALRDIAEELLAIQAARRSRPGICFGPDGEWQAPFEAAFPYQETGDQLSAIAAIKRDMEATCPMDRLLCGDVGFGKTEVAVRAAFKAVLAGKQVAVLTPTTLLCEQHGRTFAERFAGYPVTVETLSRFKPPREQRRILQRLAAGRLDVVIGTHRVLQKDVRFKDLGLAVVDEEQRFGVEHKEFFKHLRKSVDVLTLTATPIPRTLHMALLGLRDIANLTTPPRNRQAVITKVARVSDDLLRRAILRELSRGGQVFVIHPRVLDIEEFCARLAALVPEGRFGIGHGQMDSDELEEVMARFLRGELNVLVSTTIVENGLDIPTANTIVVHEADRFGLAELHQLRGRVGRAALQAYCYLLLPEHHVVTPEGLRRLRALEEYDELGAGFQLALKDLEIRGAGNVLGIEQSGQIAEIGYDLYCRLLEATVRQIRGEPVPEEELEVNIQLRGAAYIPEPYVADEKAVLELYRRLESCRDDAQLEALKEELRDRFGPPPEAAARLFGEQRLRRRARAAGVAYVGLDRAEGRVILKLHDWDLKAADRALRGLPQTRDARVLDEETLSLGLSLKAKHQDPALQKEIGFVLEVLAEFRAKRGSRANAPPPQSVKSSP